MLASYFIGQRRGTQPHFYTKSTKNAAKNLYWHTLRPGVDGRDKAYSQAHLPLSQQQTAIGHAVRFVHLMTGVAHLARLESNDEGKTP